MQELFSFTKPAARHSKVECNPLQVQFNAPTEHNQNTSQSLWRRKAEIGKNFLITFGGCNHVN